MITRIRKSNTRWWTLAAAVLVCGAALIVVIRFQQRAPESAAETASAAGACGPAISAVGGFVGSKTCRSCHEQAYASWHRSYHRTMTQRASPDAIVAPFEGERLQFEGQTYQLDRERDRYLVSVVSNTDRSGTNEPVGTTPAGRREVVMTTGSHHIQVYWICDPATNMLIEFPFYYHIADERWMLRDDTMLHPPGQPQFPSVWNDRCVKCHSVNGVPGVDPHSQTFSTTVAELGIACEACHGPGYEHVELLRSSGGRSAEGLADLQIVHPRNLKSHVATQICARCHSASTPHDQQQFLTSGIDYRPRDDLHEFIQLNAFDPTRERPRNESRDTLFVEDYATDGYWPDGTCRVGGDEYNALIESKCYVDGQLSCLSCHSMHSGTRSDQLSDIGLDNRACTQCHSEPRFEEQLSRHTRHADGSSGSSCYNCHMPHTSYALLTAMRSHRIDSPSVRESAEFNKPNACNLCHLDRTLQWTSDHLAEWYDIESPELNADQQDVAASILWLLQGNAALRVITAWHMGWEPALEASGADWQLPFLATTLHDPYAAVRYVAAQSVRVRPVFRTLQYDHVGAAGQRAEAVDAVMEIWRATATQGARANRPALLLDADNHLRTDEVERLIDQRDLRPVSIAE